MSGNTGNTPLVATKVESRHMTNSIKIQARFKRRIYPNQAQQQKLAVQFGHSRFVYNLYLSVRSDCYAATGKSSGYHDCANDLTQLKKEPEHAWPKEADSQTLQQSLKDLDTAFPHFSKHEPDEHTKIQIDALNLASRHSELPKAKALEIRRPSG